MADHTSHPRRRFIRGAAGALALTGLIAGLAPTVQAQPAPALDGPLQ